MASVQPPVISELWCKGDVSANALALASKHHERFALVALLRTLLTNESMWEIRCESERVEAELDNPQRTCSNSHRNFSALTGKYWIESTNYASREFPIHQIVNPPKAPNVSCGANRRWTVEERVRERGECNKKKDDVLPVPIRRYPTTASRHTMPDLPIQGWNQRRVVHCHGSDHASNKGIKEFN